MSLYDVYSQYNQGKITEEEAASQFGLTLRDFRFRKSRFGERLPQVLKVLDQIAADEISRSDAAALLQVEGRTINRLQQSWSTVRPVKEYKVKEAVAAIKWEIHKKYACEYIADRITLEEAAEKTNTSTRQVRRWITKLIVKHFGITFKDLADINWMRRRKMADQIEEAEGLESSKQQLLEAVAEGDMAIEELAAERLQSKHALKGRPIVLRGSKAS